VVLGLLAAIEDLGVFPERCPVARSESRHFGVMIRQLVYGKGVGRYRILYTVTDDLVVVLHVRHGRRRRFGESPAAGEDPSGGLPIDAADQEQVTSSDLFAVGQLTRDQEGLHQGAFAADDQVVEALEPAAFRHNRIAVHPRRERDEFTDRDLALDDAGAQMTEEAPWELAALEPRHAAQCRTSLAPVPRPTPAGLQDRWH